MRSRSDIVLDHLFSAVRPITSLAEKSIRQLLLVSDPELAHDITLQLLPLAQKVLYRTGVEDSRLHRRVFGLNFKNPVGVAAGVDKDARRVTTLLKCGFGFVEVGTITPRPQPGNAKKRAFRLRKDKGIINRFGFNSDGADIVLRRLVARVYEGGIVGVNVGANKDSSDRVKDYVELIETFAPVASYFTVNVSSPNTPGLRNLQESAALDNLLARVIDARERVGKNAGNCPVLLKIAPDVRPNDLDDIVGIARRRAIDGMVVSNTTTSRPAYLSSRKNLEVGGLSGRPVFKISTRVLAETYVRVEGAFPLIGAGGIDSGEAALAKIRAGADLVQIYSGLAFYGLDLIEQIKLRLIDAITCDKVGNIGDLVGLDAATITAEPWPV